MDELNKRIVEIMIRYNHSKSSFASVLGVSLPMITHITTGRNKPGIELIQKVLHEFIEVDPYWLLLGEGHMQKVKRPSVDFNEVLAKITSLNQLINNAKEMHSLVINYHKILLDEIMHVQEMNVHINHAGKDLEQLANQLEEIKKEIRAQTTTT
ncbi:MAG: helix-turn-helix domain-containing protein [Bacteroidota bacterium]|jgi:transcriptional regulator with XRE-family HTH domain